MSYLGLNTTTDDHAAKASPADVRRKNRQLIFRLLFPTNQYSRAELGRRTGLSRVAVSDVVGRMLEEGLLRETGQAPSGGKGKRGTLLSIDIDRLRIISIDLTQEHLLHGAVTNLLGQPLRHAEVTLNTGSFVSVDVIIELIEKMLGMSDGEVIGIGVASPGVVDNGVVRSSTMRGWNNLDLSTPIAEHFGLEVNVSNDATAAMLTERFFGQGGPNMLFVRIERGIGSAILLSDTPVIGELHAAGELGHISIDLDGPLCPCGKSSSARQTWSSIRISSLGRAAISARPCPCLWAFWIWQTYASMGSRTSSTRRSLTRHSSIWMPPRPRPSINTR